MIGAEKFQCFERETESAHCYLECSDLMREGYKGIGHEENSGKVSNGDTAFLNFKNEDLPGKKQEDPAIADPETMAAEDLAAAAFEVFSIPAGSGIIDFLGLTRISAAEVWFGVALSAGFMALILHKQES